MRGWQWSNGLRYVRAATSLEEHTKRWKEDGQDDLENVAAGERHLGLMYFTTRSCDGEWVTTLNGWADGGRSFYRVCVDVYI